MELIKKDLKYYEAVIEKQVSHQESADMIVPDSLPDISKISGASGNVFINEVTAQNGRLLISGAVKASIFYTPEGEARVKTLDVPINFVHIEEAAGIDETSIASVSAQIYSLTSEMLNSRKVSLTTDITLSIASYAQKGISITTDTASEDNEFIQTLSKNHEIYYPSKIVAKSFNILDSVNFENSNISKICVCKSDIQTEDIRIVSGKAVIKGNAELTELIFAENGDVSSKNHSMPFTQIIEIDGIDAEHILSCRYRIKDIEFNPDSEAEQNLYDIRISLDIFIKASKPENISVVEDLFSTKYETNIDFDTLTLSEKSYAEPITQALRENIAAEVPVASVLTCSAALSPCNISDDSKLSSELNVSVFFSDENDCLQVLNKAFPVSFDNVNSQTAPTVTIKSINASKSSDGKLNIDAELALVSCETRKSTITHPVFAEVLTEQPNKNAKKASIILRYAAKDESLWDTAKEYCSSIHDIEEANGLTNGKSIENGQLLLIPLKK